MGIKFGASGNSLSFYEEGFTSTIDTAKWLSKRGLEIYEYSFGRGVTISSKTATEIGDEFKKYNIEMSAHAPYYINFANTDEEMIKKSMGYVSTSLKILKCFGGERLVIHPGSYGKSGTEKAFELTLSNLKLMIDSYEIDKNFPFKLCFETMGKHGQIGTVKEIIEICKLSDSFYPCVDFGHINARSGGGLKTKKDYNLLILELLDNLPFEKVDKMHVHFSKIQYGEKGELRHLTFDDSIYGPEFEPLAEVLIDNNLHPHILSESDGTQAEDAVFMKKVYLDFKGFTA